MIVEIARLSMMPNERSLLLSWCKPRKPRRRLLPAAITRRQIAHDILMLPYNQYSLFYYDFHLVRSPTMVFQFSENILLLQTSLQPLAMHTVGKETTGSNTLDKDGAPSSFEADPS
jgi:hypothetical protein